MEEAEAGGEAQAFAADAALEVDAAGLGRVVGGVHGGEPEPAGVGAGLVGGEAIDDDAGGVAGEGGAAVGDAPVFVGDARGGAVEIEFAAVVGDLVVAELDEEVAEGLVVAGVAFVAGTERVVVELHAFGAGEAEEHAALGAAADGQGLGHPGGGGGGIPEGVGGFVLGHREGSGRTEGGGEAETE